MDKSERERMVMAEFAPFIGVLPGSIQSREPREPDILCSLNGEPVYFELTVGMDQCAEEKMAKYDNAGKAGGIGLQVDVFRGVCSTLKAKLREAKYTTPMAQTVYLLVYMEIGIERLLMERLENEQWLRDYVQNGPYRAIWFYDRTYRDAPVGQIEREPFRVVKNQKYAAYDFRFSVILSSIKPR